MVRDGAGLDTGAFGKRIKLTFKQSGESMPIAVRLSEGGVEGFAYADCAEGGADLRAIWSDGTELPLEIERWNDRRREPSLGART